MSTDPHLSQHLKSLLIKHWGHSTFRPIQEDIILSVIAGKDTLALLPTGGGKSICYQVPAIAQEGLCIVVSPLIALMKDQVANLRQRGINAIAIMSGMNKYEIDVALDNCVYGKVKLLYLSPERLASELVQTRISKMNVNLLAVDEAHCISQWGYDFRPSYMQISALRKFIPGVPVLAVTATATADVQQDIIEKLEFTNHKLYKRSFERKNLSYVVLHEENKMERLIQVINGVKGSGIVYVRSRRRTREIAEYLQARGISASYYHAGLTADLRTQRQEQWMSGHTRIICCTNAFGMGIDKPNVRVVVHIELPDNLESYFQEAGRAGRDEKKAYSVLLYSKSDNLEMEHRYEVNFPPLAEIRSVYQSVANYCKLAQGAGLGAAFDFDMSEFCSVYKHNSLKAYSCLHTLELEGVIALTEAVFLPSRVHFTVRLEDLYRFQVDHPAIDPFIKLMLRSYEGLFDDFVRISESELAQRSKKTPQAVMQMLAELEQLGIIKYLPQKDVPQLVFLQPRLNAKSLNISAQNLHARKQRYLERMKKLLSYASRTDKCRSSMLLDYFGEHDNFRCGVCDVCIERNKLELSEIEYGRLVEEIDTLLADGGIPYDTLVKKISAVKSEKALRAVRWLIDNKQLLCSSELIITPAFHEA